MQRPHQSCVRKHENLACTACAQDGMTPLLLASHDGNVDAVKLLLAAGATLAATNKVCRPTTSLHALFAFSRERVVVQLPDRN